MSLWGPQLPDDVAHCVAGELRRSERVVWTGQPVPGLYARRGWPSFVFGLMFAGGAVFWTAGAGYAIFQSELSNWVEMLFPAFGLPFVLVGAAMMAAPHWYARKARRTVYVITDQRAILVEGNGYTRSLSVRSFTPDQLRELRRDQRPDGRGNVVICRHWDRDSDGHPTATETGFFAIADVQVAEARLRELAARAGAEPGR